jgi:hypothetical protein
MYITTNVRILHTLAGHDRPDLSSERAPHKDNTLILILGVCILLRVRDPGEGGLFRLRNVTIVDFFTICYYLNCYILRSYDHLQVKIYLLAFTRLTTHPLFLEYS